MAFAGRDAHFAEAQAAAARLREACGELRRADTAREGATSPTGNPLSLSATASVCPVPTLSTFSLSGSMRFHQPPPSAWNKRRRVGKTRGARLHHLDGRLQIGLLRIEQQQHVGVAALHLLLREIEAELGGALEIARRPQRVGVVLQRAQRIGDVLHRADDRAPVGPRRRFVSVLAPASWCSSVPPSNTVCVALPASVQNRFCGASRLESAVLHKPALPLMVKLGSMFAVATPICALAECICSSAARTSGAARSAARAG